MPKDFLQGASLTPTFEALMVKFGGKIGTLYRMLKNAFKKHPLQNRTNVQIKGGGQRSFEQCSKKLHFSLVMASLSWQPFGERKNGQKIYVRRIFAVFARTSSFLRVFANLQV